MGIIILKLIFVSKVKDWVVNGILRLMLELGSGLLFDFMDVFIFLLLWYANFIKVSIFINYYQWDELLILKWKKVREIALKTIVERYILELKR